MKTRLGFFFCLDPLNDMKMCCYQNISKNNFLILFSVRDGVAKHMNYLKNKYMTIQM